MRALRLLQYGAPLELQDVALRTDGVRVNVRAAGICHSDAHYRAGRGKTSLPLTLGHEVAGVTESGERVAIHYLFPNGDMIGKEADGGYAESIVVPPGNLVHVPDNVPFEHAAIMMCSTATVFHALRVAPLQHEETLAILGFGGLGFSALQLARALRGGRVYVVDRVPEKLAMAEKFGAIAVDDPAKLPPVDVALDLAGNEALTLAGLRALKPGGRLMVIAINLRSMTIDPYADVLGKERRIIGVADHTREELVQLMELASCGGIDLAPAITRTVPFEADAVNSVLDELDRGTPHLRSVIRF
jgi:2-desacetyl-2-hydroxyethyl bacteriochlorophyllide A dehydrogenase